MMKMMMSAIFVKDTVAAMMAQWLEQLSILDQRWQSEVRNYYTNFMLLF
jgi:hypothetical protein